MHYVQEALFPCYQDVTFEEGRYPKLRKSTGLSTEEALFRLRKVRQNEVLRKKPFSFFTKIFRPLQELRLQLRYTSSALRDNEWKTIDVSLLVPGDLIKLAAGDIVPADCMLNEGSLLVDQAALTGESIPIECTERQRILQVRGNTSYEAENANFFFFFLHSTRWW